MIIRGSTRNPPYFRAFAGNRAIFHTRVLAFLARFYRCRFIAGEFYLLAIFCHFKAIAQSYRCYIYVYTYMVAFRDFLSFPILSSLPFLYLRTRNFRAVFPISRASILCELWYYFPFFFKSKIIEFLFQNSLKFRGFQVGRKWIFFRFLTPLPIQQKKSVPIKMPKSVQSWGLTRNYSLDEIRFEMIRKCRRHFGITFPRVGKRRRQIYRTSSHIPATFSQLARNSINAESNIYWNGLWLANVFRQNSGATHFYKRRHFSVNTREGKKSRPLGNGIYSFMQTRATWRKSICMKKGFVSRCCLLFLRCAKGKESWHWFDAFDLKVKR